MIEDNVIRTVINPQSDHGRVELNCLHMLSSRLPASDAQSFEPSFPVPAPVRSAVAEVRIRTDDEMGYSDRITIDVLREKAVMCLETNGVQC